MKNERLAAIDIGTNSIRCIVVEASSNGSYRVLDDEKDTVRLGEGIASSGAISDAAIKRAEQAAERMARLVKGLGVKGVEAVATSAVRSASNGPQLVHRLESILEVPIRVISGEEEAELATQSALRNFDMQGQRYGVMDVGGGSVELTTAQGQVVEEHYSLELGAVVMTERFLKGDPVKQTEMEKLRSHIRNLLKKRFGSNRPLLPSMVGSGGTITAIAQMVLLYRREELPSTHGVTLLRSEIVHILAMLQRKGLSERKSVPGLSPDRADIIIAGVAVVDTMMEFFGSNSLLVNARGIREGGILQALQRHGLSVYAPSSRSWRDSVLDFGRNCQIEEAHALQVSWIALSIFDDVAKPCGLKKRDRVILETAAILHDAGAWINYESHHKHSYHLIRHANLYGLSPRERELAAQVARYHRKALPKRKHESFQKLSQKEQILVSRLGGILRLADGLDRRRCSAIRKISCAVQGEVARLAISGSDDLAVEIFGGGAKKELFERAFGLQVIFAAHSEAETSTNANCTGWYGQIFNIPVHTELLSNAVKTIGY